MNFIKKQPFRAEKNQEGQRSVAKFAGASYKGVHSFTSDRRGHHRPQHKQQQ